MKYPFTIKDIAVRVKRTEQSLYSLMKKNQDFIKQNSHREGRFIRYNQAALDWFVEYYGTEDGSHQENTQEPPQEDHQEASHAPVEDLTAAVLKVKVEALEKENEDLRQRLLAVDAERRELLKIVQGTAIASVQKERLLPPPQKTIVDRIKGWFSGSRNDHSYD